MSSLFKVPLTKIIDIKPHSNADSLELATVYGFQVIVKKGMYKVGDLVVYVPVRSIVLNGFLKTIFQINITPTLIDFLPPL